MSTTTEDRAQFGAKPRQQREARALSVPDAVKLTKIPERSLNRPPRAAITMGVA